MQQHQRIAFTSAVALTLVIPTTLLSLAGCGSSGKSSAAPKATTSSAPVIATATPTGTPTPTPTKPRPQTFVVTEHDTNLVYTPKGGVPATTGPKGRPAPGDRTQVTALILRGSTVVGSLSYTDDFVAGNRVLIKGTLVLANGRLSVDGLVPLVEPTVIPIVTGTSAFAGLTGKLTAAGLNAHDARLTITLH